MTNRADRSFARVSAAFGICLAVASPIGALDIASSEPPISVSPAPGPGTAAPSSSAVVATIDGEEIRADDVDLEIALLHAPSRADKAIVARRALQNIVQQRLLIRAIGDPGMRVDPALPASARRDQEAGFLFTCFRRRALSVPPPSDAEADAYAARHPNEFASRHIYRVGQLRLKGIAADMPQLSAIADDHTLDAVAAHLGTLGLPFERGIGALDTADVPADLVTEIQRLPGGEPFVLPKGDDTMIYAVMGREDVNEPPRDTHRRAVEGARKERDFAFFAARVAEERARAKISYAPGFEPLPSPRKPL